MKCRHKFVIIIGLMNNICLKMIIRNKSDFMIIQSSVFFLNYFFSSLYCFRIFTVSELWLWRLVVCCEQPLKACLRYKMSFDWARLRRNNTNGLWRMQCDDVCNAWGHYWKKNILYRICFFLCRNVIIFICVHCLPRSKKFWANHVVDNLLNGQLCIECWSIWQT